MQVNEAKQLKELEKENSRLKKLLAEVMLDNQVLKDINSGNLSPKRMFFHQLNQ